MRPGAAVLLLAAFVAVTALPPAEAHASRLSCTPEPGARLDAAPDQVVVVLTEPIEAEGTTMSVVDQEGQRADRGDLVVEHGQNPRLTLSLQPGLPGGAYTISWQVLSKDTHTVRESCGFAVGAFQPPDSVQEGRQDVDPAAAAARALAYAGLALGLGAFGLLALRPPGPAALAATLTKAIALGAGLHTVGLLLLVRYTTGESGLALGEFLDSGVGRNMAARLVAGLAALAIAGLAVVRPTRLGPPAAGLLMLGAAYGSAAYSHSFAHGVSAVAVDFLHLVASATWVGALAIFLALLGRGARGLTPEEALPFGVRFGTLALACVILLFLAGVTVSLILLGMDAVRHPMDTLASPYGRFLAAKILLALAMVALAAVNKFVLLAPPSGKGLAGALQRVVRPLGASLAPLPGSGTRGLRNLVAVEAVLGAAVLVLAAALTSISPPAAASSQEAGLHLRGLGDSFEVLAVVSPAPEAGGTSSITLYIHDVVAGEDVVDNSCDATGTRDTCVDLLIGAGNGSSGTDRHVALPDGQGAWRVEGVLWGFAGNATATVRIQTAAVFEDTVSLQFQVS